MSTALWLFGGMLGVLLLIVLLGRAVERGGDIWGADK